MDEIKIFRKLLEVIKFFNVFIAKKNSFLKNNISEWDEREEIPDPDDTQPEDWEKTEHMTDPDAESLMIGMTIWTETGNHQWSTTQNTKVTHIRLGVKLYKKMTQK